MESYQTKLDNNRVPNPIISKYANKLKKIVKNNFFFRLCLSYHDARVFHGMKISRRWLCDTIFILFMIPLLFFGIVKVINC